jgi:hypothetical protein
MSGVSTARPLRRNLLAVCLCFLAFAFAIEAKWAWYGPQGGPVSDVSAAKARPAEVPDVVVHGVPAPDLVNLQIPYALLATFAVACFLSADVLLRRDVAYNHTRVSAAPYFSADHFFRPPPIR